MNPLQLTNAGNTPNGCEPRNYSYWPQINNHRGQDHFYVFVGRIGQKPLLFRVTKATNHVDVVEALPWEGTGEGWYFSDTRPFDLYVLDGPKILRYNVVTRSIETVAILESKHGSMLRQAHSSSNDEVHSATASDGNNDLGSVVFRRGQQRFFPAGDGYDECQVDKSGRYLIIQRTKNNYIPDLDKPGEERVILQNDGAVGHCDVGDGIVIGEDDSSDRWQLVLWDLRTSEPRRVLLRGPALWGDGLGHVALRGNLALVSRPNELITVPLDGSQIITHVCPSLMTPPSGVEPYDYQVKANWDALGEYCCWLANNNSGTRLEAFVTHVTDVPSQPPPRPEPGGSMKPLILFTTPLTMEVELVHDQQNFSVKGVPGTDDNGRAGHDLVLDESLPEGNGCRIFVRDGGRTVVEQRAVLWLKERITKTGRVKLDRPCIEVDDFYKPEGF